jgi:hypothetical protein
LILIPLAFLHLYGLKITRHYEEFVQIFAEGTDEPEEITKWARGIRFIEEMYFTDNEEIEKPSTATGLWILLLYMPDKLLWKTIANYR